MKTNAFTKFHFGPTRVTSDCSAETFNGTSLRGSCVAFGSWNAEASKRAKIRVGRWSDCPKASPKKLESDQSEGTDS
jgi:hypothetical protein